MQLHDARRAARVGTDGRYVAFEEQDRSLWDRDQIDDGLRSLERTMGPSRPGEYQLQAAITALHIQRSDTQVTDWVQIAALYGELLKVNPSPVVEINHAAAVGFAVGAEAGLALLQPLLGHPSLERYQPLYAAHADLLRRTGDVAGAAQAYERAIALSANAVERTELQRRLEVLTAS
jgi:RNA polymerase sigma-70 factor (ECF subfamily)